MSATGRLPAAVRQRLALKGKALTEALPRDGRGGRPPRAPHTPL